VVVAGGGDSAVDWALSLAEVAEQVMVVHRRAKFRAAPQSAVRLQALADEGRIELVIPYQLHALEGADGQLSAVIVADLAGRTRRLAADCLLPFSDWPLISARWRPGGSISSTIGSASIPPPAPPRGREFSRSATSLLSREAEADPLGLRRGGACRARDPSACPSGRGAAFRVSTTKGVPGR